jgi:hypothetical protein
MLAFPLTLLGGEDVVQGQVPGRSGPATAPAQHDPRSGEGG